MVNKIRTKSAASTGFLEFCARTEIRRAQMPNHSRSVGGWRRFYRGLPWLVRNVSREEIRGPVLATFSRPPLVDPTRPC
jgi:hypothetical protein